ncbi:hypothetical protein MHB40_14675 [Lysinibacillus sp. FSL K6-0057]|uniref:hypothetical protein n=1 Tax=Lysinibacillus sp. FSL K6-0057 TaxID=2921411 RepID=UPI00315A8693
MNKLECSTCKKRIEDGKTFKDGYFGGYHCSFDCLVSYMCEFFDVTKEPNITVIGGVPYYDEELDEKGRPINSSL